MEVILLERIGKLGQMGDIVTVKDGFARNFLLPQGKALRATDDNKSRFESERAQLEARNLELKKEAGTVSTKLDGQAVIAIRQAGDTGQLYGSVSTRDIADLITAAGFNVSRNQVQLDKPIKTIGIHPMQVSLHPEVIVTVDVNVARSEDEAKRQARGEDMTVQEGEAPMSEEDTIAAEEVFEDEELAQQAEEGLAEAEADFAAEPDDGPIEPATEERSDGDEPTDESEAQKG